MIAAVNPRNKAEATSPVLTPPTSVLSPNSLSLSLWILGTESGSESSARGAVNGRTDPEADGAFFAAHRVFQDFGGSMLATNAQTAQVTKAKTWCFTSGSMHNGNTR
eukprot:CAMPEP_0172784486 /NCGR_PEP_ID=MMETSP1074-20121228/204966_1 /TAXON_ID=2916 /ORGANISM="Ceratium fusus, Strain PA161109" /LENGTH=106 /DNA_ID=CAMNT_0013621489 /DNA_START=2015 /DNA_END=2332 /DNA_ORIENTATION=+